MVAPGPGGTSPSARREPVTFERSVPSGRCRATLFLGSSERMPEVDDGSVALTVTSPPYWDAIDYARHASDARAPFRPGPSQAPAGTYATYLDGLVRIFAEVRRATKPGGFLAVVVGTVLRNGSQYALPFDLVPRLVGSGWAFHQDIVWHKTTGGVKRAGVYIQRPRPGYYHPNIMTEYILVFRNPGPPIFRRDGAPGDGTGRVGALFTRELANNVWHIPPVPPLKMAVLDHPCPFPEEIPERLISLYSYPGDLVLDPFLGSGQTAKVALALGRNAVGYDTVPSYVALARRRLEEPSGLRPDQLVARFEKVARSDPLPPRRARRGKGVSRQGSGRPGARKRAERAVRGRE